MLDDNISAKQQIQTMLWKYRYNLGRKAILEIVSKGAMPEKDEQEYAAELQQITREVAEVEALVALLPEKERIVIKDKYMSVAHMSVKDIARAVGYSKQNVHALKRKAIAKMAEMLKPEREEK